MPDWKIIRHGHQSLHGLVVAEPEDLPTVFADPRTGDIETDDRWLTPEEARRYAAVLCEAAAIAEGQLTPRQTGDPVQ